MCNLFDQMINSTEIFDASQIGILTSIKAILRILPPLEKCQTAEASCSAVTLEGLLSPEQIQHLQTFRQHQKAAVEAVENYQATLSLIDEKTESLKTIEKRLAQWL